MKRKETLLRAMSEIRPQYIEDANAFAETEKHDSSFRIWRTGVRIAVAACAAVAVFVFYPRGENEVSVTQTSTAEKEIVSSNSTQKTDAIPAALDEYANTGTDMNDPEVTGTYPIDRTQETGIENNNGQATVTDSQTAEAATQYTVWMITDGTMKTVEYETTEDPFHTTAKTETETNPVKTTTYTTATFHIETKTLTLPYIPPHEVEQKDVICWHDCGLRTDGKEAESPFDLHDSITIPALPGYQFTWENETIAVSKDGTQTALFGGMPIWSAYFTDLTGDGIPELCVNSSFGSGMVDEHITVYDCMEQKQYDLWDRGVFDYRLSMENDSLTVERTLNIYNTAESNVQGSIVLKDGIVYFVEKGKQLDTSKPPITEYTDGSVLTWFDMTQESVNPNETLRFRISAYPDIVFTYENEMLYFEQNGHKSMVSYTKTLNAFFTDITGDGQPEICITAQVRSALNSVIPLQVTVMDIGQKTGHLVYYMNDQDGSYRDIDNEYDYILYTENGELFVNKNSWLSEWGSVSKHGIKGKVRFKDNNLVFDEID